MQKDGRENQNQKGGAQKRDDNQSGSTRQSGSQRKRYYNKKTYRGKSQNQSKGLIISVVVPLYNEEESIPELALELERELSKIAQDKYEVIFVDDGSTDNSFEEIKKVNARNNRFKAIRFRRNFGKSAALSVGFDAAKGVIVITMDADLQDDPKEISNLINKLKEGYDLVSGWKKKRRDPITKTIPSRLFNSVVSMTCGLKLHDYNCGLKAYKRDAAKSIDVYGEMHRYIPAIAHWEGFKVTEIPVQHHPRQYGKSKYGFSRFINGFLDLLTFVFTTRYMKRPLHLLGSIGAFLTVVGFAINAYLTVEWALGYTFLSNRPLALLGVALIIVGVQFVSVGLIGELVVKNTLKKNEYNIRDRL